MRTRITKYLWIASVSVAVLMPSLGATAQGKFVELHSLSRQLDVAKVGLNDPVWGSLPRTDQPLQAQFMIQPKPTDIGVKTVSVRSIHDSQFIAFKLSWKDNTRDDGIGIVKFSDAAALEFPVQKKPLPQFFMGEPQKPVHIINWKAWRSRDKRDGMQTVKTAYPNMHVDMYNFDYPVKGAGTEKTEAEKNIFIPGRAAGNPLSMPGKEIIEELIAEGYGSMRSMKIENTTGEAEWKNGEWSVVFRRPLIVADKESVQFKIGERMPLAFAIWDGGRNEVGGRKAVSGAWAEIEVDAK